MPYIIGFIVFILLILFVATLISFHLCCVKTKKPPRLRGKMGKDSPADTIFKQNIEEGRKWIMTIPFSEERIKSDDGLELFGRFYRNGNSKTTILMMHGFRSNSIHDFSCAFKFYFDKGFNILLADQRAHGKSDGKYITYGVKERFDARRWLEHINTLVEDGELYATGVSMGASTVLMMAELDLPKNLLAIIADCGFTSPADIIKKVMHQDMGFPLFPLYYTTRLWARLVAGFDFEEVNAAKTVENCEIPLFFLHGKDDGFVPFYMGEEIFAAAKGKKTAVWVDGADHGCSFLVDHETCAKTLSNFLGI